MVDKIIKIEGRSFDGRRVTLRWTVFVSRTRTEEKSVFIKSLVDTGTVETTSIRVGQRSEGEGLGTRSKGRS